MFLTPNLILASSLQNFGRFDRCEEVEMMGKNWKKKLYDYN